MEEEKPIPKLLKKLFNRKSYKNQKEINNLKHEIEKAKLKKELDRINNEK